MDDNGDEPSAATAFTVQNQTLELDFSFCPRRVKGKTTIEIQPLSPKLREITLNCRQLKPTRVTIKGFEAAFHYSDLYDRLSLHPGTGIQQHHFPQKRLRRHEQGLEEELLILVPDKIRLRDVSEPGKEPVWEPFEVQVEYVLDVFRDALHFAGVEDGDARYPHVYTRNSPYPGMASALFPCVDDGSTRCNFDISIRYPRTVGDALFKSSRADCQSQTNGANGSSKADSVMSGTDDHHDLTEEEKTLEMSVICSGLLTDEV